MYKLFLKSSDWKNTFLYHPKIDRMEFNFPNASWFSFVPFHDFRRYFVSCKWTKIPQIPLFLDLSVMPVLKTVLSLFQTHWNVVYSKLETKLLRLRASRFFAKATDRQLQQDNIELEYTRNKTTQRRFWHKSTCVTAHGTVYCHFNLFPPLAAANG